MSGGVVESVKQVLEERIKNPLWGFIILAWFWFNWPNLAMLFMSDAPVKFRIDYILSQHYFYLQFIVAPVISGGCLAVVTPYAQWLLSKAHKWAEDRHRYNVFLSKSADYEDSKKLSKLKVQSDRAVEAENAKIDADIKAEIERGKREALVTEELEASKQSMLVELDNMKNSISSLKKESDKIQDLIIESLSVMERFFKINDGNSIQQLRSEVEKLYSKSQIEISTIRNSLKDGRELNEEQHMILLDKAAETLKKRQADGLGY
ncbi:hypothetical protein J1F15_00750 [Enterobacter bugandensis]|uniref:hypothetical protein n=1 Tax=Enterobacter bugandensis TaxID=881260 RepID=UPI001A9350A6|nr:hypothetical protein [Enterobacter bugandensis]MBO0400940.1 hypothetical protein [Enterobacter bugandensis]